MINSLYNVIKKYFKFKKKHFKFKKKHIKIENKSYHIQYYTPRSSTTKEIPKQSLTTITAICLATTPPVLLALPTVLPTAKFATTLANLVQSTPLISSVKPLLGILV